MAESPLRVLHFVGNLTGGGAETQLALLLRALDESRFVSAVCCFEEGGARSLPDSVSVFAEPRRHRFDQRWGRIRDVIRSWSPHLVHNWLPLVLWSALVPTRLVSGTPFLASYRNVYTPLSARRLLQSAGFLLSDRIVSNVHPEDLRQPFRWLYRLRRGVFIPNGFAEADGGEPVSPASLGLRDDCPTILYAGRFARHKDAGAVLRALRSLRDQDIQLQALFCGRGPEEGELRRAADQIGERFTVRFAGFRRDLGAILRACRCLILPSRREGMPNVVFEAMAASVAVIASDIAPHRRWLRDRENALLFAPGDTESLALHIRSLMTDAALRRRLVEAGLETVRSLSVANMVAAYERLYSEMTARPAAEGRQ